MSAGPPSGAGYHYFDACSLTPEQGVQNLMVWVKVDETAGILSHRDADRLAMRLTAALRHFSRGNQMRGFHQLKMFVDEVEALANSESITVAAAQPLIDEATAHLPSTLKR
jgi:hypothetical protein